MLDRALKTSRLVPFVLLPPNTRSLVAITHDEFRFIREDDLLPVLHRPLGILLCKLWTFFSVCRIGEA